MDWDRDVAEEAEMRLVRPYALTRGRTRASVGDLPLEALVVTTAAGRAAAERLRHETRAIVELCAVPQSVAEVSARLRVPLGVARVLVGDLLVDEFVQVHRATVNAESRLDVRLLERVLDGLQAL